MSLEIIDRCSLHRHFLHQVDIMELETVVRDEANFKDHAYGRGAMLYDASLRDPHIVADRSLSYFLMDINGLFPRGVKLSWVEIREVDNLIKHKTALGTSSAVVCLIGSFDSGRIKLGDRSVSVDAGDCLVIPDRKISYKVLPPKAGKVYVMIAHGTKLIK